MKSYQDIEREQARKAREHAKEIKQFNENLKANPVLMENELYLVKNMYYVRLKLKQLPEKHMDNVLFITEYFKIERESVNFKYIKPEILNNPLFLVNALLANPEIYFFVNPENQKTFKEQVISVDKEYLKYLSKEDYDKPEILKKIAFSFKSFTESLNYISEEMLNKILNSEHGQYAQRDLLKMDVNQCNNLKNALEPYLEKNKEIKGEFWFDDMLNKNPYFYTVLNQEKYKDKSSKELIVSLAGKHHDLFVYLPQEWKEDLSIVARVISDRNETADRYQYHGMKYHNNIKNVALILNEYGNVEKFIAEKINDINIKHIRPIYPQLTTEWRKEETIIKALFKEKDNFEISLDYCRSIPYEELAENLVTQLKNYKVRTLDEVGESLEKIVMYHFLKQNLESKNIKEKKLKI